MKQAFYELDQDQTLRAKSESNVANRQNQLALAEARVRAGSGAPADLVQAKTALADAVISMTTARSTEQVARLNLATVIGIDSRIPISVKPSSEARTEGTADDLVARALHNRPEVKQATAKVDAARFGVRGASLSNAPSISLATGYSASGVGNPFDTQSDSIGLNLSWNLLDGGATAGKVRSARGALQVAEQQLRQATLAATQDVLQSLLAIQTAESKVATAEVQVANAKELVRIQSGRYAGGIGAFLDVTSAQDNLYTAEKNLIQSQNDLQKARAALKHAIGPRMQLSSPRS